MWLALGEPHDPHLPWAAEGLRRRGLKPLELVTSADLVRVRLVHRLSDEDSAVHMVLADGRIVDGEAVQGVLNRMWSVPDQGFGGLSDGDREYATRELYAAVWSSLAVLTAPVLNPPATTGLCGVHRHPAVWLQLAQQAGLPCRAWHSADGGRFVVTGLIARAWVVGVQVLTARSLEPYRDACLRLAQLAQTPLLEIRFVSDEGGNQVVESVRPVGALMDGGERLLDALAAALVGGPASP